MVIKFQRLWIATPQEDAADEKTKRPRAARKSLAGSLLIAKTKNNRLAAKWYYLCAG